MNRMVAVLAIMPLLLQPQARMRKVFISADMEGITGVVQPAQLGPDGFEYQRAREWMTGEVNAAIEGIRQTGPAEIVVCDSHGNGQSVLIERLPEDVRLVRGFPRPLEMMQGIDDTFAAAVFIGYHGSEFATGAVRGHTISSARLLGIRLNGMEVSEGIYNAALAGEFGVPVAFVSGDRIAVEQLQKVIPTAEGAIVKEPYGYHSAMSVTPARGQAMIREGLARAMGKLTSLRPYRVTSPIALDVGFKLTIDAERAAFVPGLSRSDAHHVQGSFKNMVEITKLLQVLTSLEAP